MSYIFSKSGTTLTITSDTLNISTREPGTVMAFNPFTTLEISFPHRSPIKIPVADIDTIAGIAPNVDIDILIGQIMAVMPDQDQSSTSAESITPHNSTNLAKTTRGIYVGVTGDVTAVVNGTAILFKNAVQGSVIPVQATRVNSTGTTATNLVALY